MNLLTITWSGGENNPFAYFNESLRHELRSLGVRCFDVELGPQFGPTLNDILAKNRIDIALTFQGLGTHILDQNQRNIWEVLGIQLVALHGDHPCHMPANHATDLPHVHHLYGAPSWAVYSETHFRRQKPVHFFIAPNFFKLRSPVEPVESEAFFVFPKNLDDIRGLLAEWQEKFPSDMAALLTEATHAIQENCRAGDPIEHHELIDQLLTPERFDSLVRSFKPTSAKELFHYIHSLLDKIYRNAVSEVVMAELHDVPMLICGRGWDRHQQKASRFHTFKSFDTVANGDHQFRSRYGILDVTPSKDSFHDRALRAMALGGGFLSNSQLNFSKLIGTTEPALFYTCRPGDLRQKAEAVMQDPGAHRARCADFSRAWDQQFTMYNFYQFLTSLKK